MNPMRRELLNGLFVLVVASLMSAAFAAFQVNFNIEFCVLVLIGVGIAVSGYVMFEIALGYMATAEQRKKTWIKRIGTPARFELNEGATTSAGDAIWDAIKVLTPSADYISISYFLVLKVARDWQ